MPEDNSFPKDPFKTLDSSQWWAPSEEELGEEAYRKLLPPLVHEIRKEVNE